MLLQNFIRYESDLNKVDNFYVTRKWKSLYSHGVL